MSLTNPRKNALHIVVITVDSFNENIQITQHERSNMTMMVKCKACGEVHSSAIQVDQMRFQTVTLTNNSEDCPKCHATSTYNKEDYFFQ